MLIVLLETPVHWNCCSCHLWCILYIGYHISIIQSELLQAMNSKTWQLLAEEMTLQMCLEVSQLSSFVLNPPWENSEGECID